MIVASPAEQRERERFKYTCMYTMAFKEASQYTVINYHLNHTSKAKLHENIRS